MKTNYQKISNSAKRAVLGIATAALLYFSTGCASMNYDVKPLINARTDSSGKLETMAGAGLVISPKAKSVKGTSKDPEYHSGFCRETAQTLLGPFHIYRAKDSKWFPEFREHPYRTTGMTILYIGAAAMSGGGSSSGKKTEPQPNQPSNPGDKPKPVELTQPSDPGHSGGDGY